MQYLKTILIFSLFLTLMTQCKKAEIKEDVKINLEDLTKDLLGGYEGAYMSDDFKNDACLIVIESINNTEIEVIAPQESGHPNFYAEVSKRELDVFKIKIPEQTVGDYLIKGLEFEDSPYHGAFFLNEKTFNYKILIQHNNTIDTINYTSLKLDFPCHCFNQILDEGEMNVDCGGECDNCPTIKRDTIAYFSEKVKRISFLNANYGIVFEKKYPWTQVKLTEDGGRNWKVIPSPQSIVRVHDIMIINENTFLIAQFDPSTNTTKKSMLSTDKGNTWQELDYKFKKLIKNNDQIVALADDKIYYSYDGISWTNKESNFTNFDIIDIEFISDQVGFLIVNQSIYKTNNAGVNWDFISEITISEIVTNIYFINENFGYALGPFKELLCTKDGGYTWEVQYRSGDEHHLMYFYNGKGVVIGNRVISVSHNNGLNWKEYSDFSNGHFPNYKQEAESHVDNYFFFLEQHNGNDDSIYLIRIDLDNLTEV